MRDCARRRPRRHSTAAAAASGTAAAPAQARAAPAPAPNAGPVQPWGLPPLPQGVGPVEKFADLGGTPQGQFLEGGAFDTEGNLWFVAIGSGWISYLTPEGKLIPVVNCNPPPDIGQTCEPQGTRWHEGKLYLTTRHRGILIYDPQTKELKTLVYTYSNQLFKGPNDLDFDAEGNLFFTDPWATGVGPNMTDHIGRGVPVFEGRHPAKNHRRFELPERDRGLAGQQPSGDRRLHGKPDGLRDLRHRADT